MKATMVCKIVVTVVTMLDMEHISPRDVIDALGGTAETARICDVEPQAVSMWVKRGFIPAARLMYLRLLHPEVFDPDHQPDRESA